MCLPSRYRVPVRESGRGTAYFTNTMTIGEYILMDFMQRKTRGMGWA